jgi:hypothetical protein
LLVYCIYIYKATAFPVVSHGRETSTVTLRHAYRLRVRWEKGVEKMLNEKPTNALIIQCIGTQYSATCFGTLKCHHQGVKHDPAETGTQCRGKLRRMGAVYCNRWPIGLLHSVISQPSHHLLQYTAPILLCFPQHWAPISAGSCLTP